MFTCTSILTRNPTFFLFVFVQYLLVCFFKNVHFCPGRVDQLVGILPPTPKSCGSDSKSGNISKLQVQSLVRAPTGRN